jgi:FkbM family methyltransferase
MYKYGHDWELRPNTWDDFILEETFTDPLYGLELLEDKSVQLVVDIGACIGTFTVKVLDAFPPARVIAFEPIPENVEIFKKNTRVYSSRIELHTVPVYGITRPGRLWRKELVPGRRVNMGTSRYEYSENGTTRGYDVRRLRQTIDLLKLDCEGGEYSIIPAIDWSKVGYAMIEYHNVGKSGVEVEKHILQGGLVAIYHKTRWKTVVNRAYARPL